MDGSPTTDWFKTANLTDDKEFDNVTLTKTNVTQIKVSYKSGKYSHPHFRLSCKDASVFIYGSFPYYDIHTFLQMYS